MVRKIVWTMSLAAAGIFLTVRSAPIHPKWLMCGGIFGALIGLGFGTMFSTKNIRLAGWCWTFIFGLFGTIYGLEDPISFSRLATCALGGVVVGGSIGTVSYLVAKGTKCAVPKNLI